METLVCDGFPSRNVEAFITSKELVNENVYMETNLDVANHFYNN